MPDRTTLLARLDEINKAIREALILLAQVTDQKARDDLMTSVQELKNARVEVEAKLSAKHGA